MFEFSYGDPSAGDRMIDAQFATSTRYVATTMGGRATMFGVNFADGRIKGYPIGSTVREPNGKGFFVLYVRVGSGVGTHDYVDVGDGTVTDRATGLTWTQADSGAAGTAGVLTWKEALAWAEGLELGGHDDWRLPDAKELQSLVDYGRSPTTTGSAAADPVFASTPITDEGGFPNFASYWTSTTHVAEDGRGRAAVYVSFGEALGWMRDRRTGLREFLDVHGAGAQRSDPKTGDASRFPYGRGPQGDVIRIRHLVRAVRGGDVTEGAGEPPPAAIGPFRPRPVQRVDEDRVMERPDEDEDGRRGGRDGGGDPGRSAPPAARGDRRLRRRRTGRHLLLRGPPRRGRRRDLREPGGRSRVQAGGGPARRRALPTAPVGRYVSN